MPAILRACQMGITSENPGSKFHFLFFFFILSSLALACSAASSITQGQTLKDGDTLLSDDQIFELGFFSPVNSSSRYVGIWYFNIPEPEQSVVWVANRETPISDKAGVLTIGSDGNLVVLDGNKTKVWSSNASLVSQNSTATLKDTGKFVLSITESVYWESFDDPTDTYLPDMRVPMNSTEGENRYFTSWKSASDPSPGGYSLGVDPRGSPQLVIWEGSKRRWRSGHWNKQLFIGIPNMPTTYSYGFKFSDEVNGSKYFTYTPWNASDKLRFRIRWDGYEEQLRWQEEKNQWEVIQSQPNKSNECELYNKCGNFGVCRASDDSCRCMDGFEPRNLDQWHRGNWSEGCLRKTPLLCQRNSTNGTEENGEEDGFVRIRSAKLPDFADLVSPVPPDRCEETCFKNCSCTAYAEVTGLGCMIWTGELLDVQQFTKGGETLNIRLAHSDLGNVTFCLLWMYTTS